MVAEGEKKSETVLFVPKAEQLLLLLQSKLSLTCSKD